MYEVNFDSQEYKETAEREVQKTNYRRCIRIDNEKCYFRRNICFYKRKSKLYKNSFPEKIHSGIFKIIRIQSDPRTVVRIEVICNSDAFGK